MADFTDSKAECLCGRTNSRVHCPNCGSYQTIGYATRVTAIREGGKKVELKAYRCVVCAEIFNDDHWQLNCHAPAYKPRGRPRKLTVRVDSAEERAALLEHLREIQKLRDLSDR